MNAERALHLATAQERLERAGWHFESMWCRSTGKFWAQCVHTRTRKVYSCNRPSRADALAQVLQFATSEQEMASAAE